MDDINFTLDFLIDLYKVVSINEQVVYGDIKLSNDIFYKNKIGSIINDYLKLPDNYITVTDSGQVIEKSTTLLHIQLIEVFNKLQKKHYPSDDLFGICKKTDIITSFYDDTDYICDAYLTNKYKSSQFKRWISGYTNKSVYIESADFKFYGGDECGIVITNIIESNKHK